MARQTIYVVQPFDLSKDGKGVVPATPQPAKRLESAVDRAQRLMASRRHVGVIAFSRTGDPDIGEYDEPKILYSAGNVPDDLP